eukprot:gene11810-18227_t
MTADVRLIATAAVTTVLVYLGTTAMLPKTQQDGPVRDVVVQERLEAEIHTLKTQLTHKRTAQDVAKLFPTTAKLDSSKRRNILITGGAGFVGSNLADVLMKEGHRVTVLDNFFTGRLENIIHWVGHPNFNFIEHDVVDRVSLVVDQIYHLASPASPPHYMFDPMKTIRTNTIGTENMLEIARATGARVLFTSTSEVYGDPLVHPQVETYWGNVNPIGPRACYDEAKRLGETIMYSYQAQYKVDVRVVRIFNTFGPRMHPNDGRVVSNFIIQALQGQPLSIYGSGSNTRSFQFVDDLVRGIKLTMEGNCSTPINIGNPDEYTVKSFAEKILSLTKSSSEIRYLPPSTDDPTQRKPD